MDRASKILPRKKLIRSKVRIKFTDAFLDAYFDCVACFGELAKCGDESKQDAFARRIQACLEQWAREGGAA